ncbi:Helix-turn-helix domain protein [Roseovarius sp. THAF27]|uniref:helix-turn-helix transcriptional regulator n=1 Tax=Roseovarius sp. THAF27 TaxID=2587850 RepID=UPI001269225D|nr:helix-turn-helix domain-containing protein [Roseovarius sp. THAF27]QFT82333.1 Helix-turn-helix domain protein [Roseovarius sp. THAF27]
MSQKEQSDLKLLTRSEVEQEYGIGKRYLEVAATRREGPAFIKIGRSIRYRREDLESWILEQRVETAADRSVQ